jgi:predicted nucleic acid-binding protein
MILTDTGFWVALINDKDRHHSRATTLLAQLDQPLLTTWPVVTETCHLLTQRLNVHAQTKFLQSLQTGLFEVFQLQQHHYDRILELVVKYADLPMDLADASIVIAAEATGTGNILSTDQRDFAVYRWKNEMPFNNLLLL